LKWVCHKPLKYSIFRWRGFIIEGKMMPGISPESYGKYCCPYERNGKKQNFNGIILMTAAAVYVKIKLPIKAGKIILIKKE